MNWCVMDHGDRLQSLGLALETLANLLGADGSEHHLDPKDIDGLAHAARIMGGYAFAAGGELYEAGRQGCELADKIDGVLEPVGGAV